MKKILLIDDEPELLFGLSAVVKRAGFAALTAADGEKGLELARQERPDLVVCDVMMPSPNGWQIKRLLAGDPATAGIPFLFLTARANLEDKLAGLSSGADDYITKPFRVEELIERIRAVLRRHEAGRQEGLAEADKEIDRLRRFLHLTAQLVATSDQTVGQLDFASEQGEAWRLYSRDTFENRLDSLNNPALFPVGVVVVWVGGSQLAGAEGTEKRDRSVVQVLKTVLDPDHLLFKFGTDQWVVLLPRVDDRQVYQMVVDVRTGLDQRNRIDPADLLDLRIGAAVAQAGGRLSAVLREAQTRMSSYSLGSEPEFLSRS